jgi:alanyl-tRNA synthetase
VLDVVEQGDAIVHVTSHPLPLGPIHGEINAARRRDYTIQHTAQHLLSALAGDRFGWSTESVHFGEERSTIEFDVAQATSEQLEQLEQWANDIVAEARAVTVGYEDAAVASGLRKPTEREGTIRVVTIEGIDRSACGGTHVTSTARLGSVMVRGVERIRGRVRVGFLAGPRALGLARREAAMLEALAGELGAAPADLAELVPRRLAALRDAERRIEALERELAGFRVRALIGKAPSGPGGVRWVVLHPADRSVVDHSVVDHSVAALRTMAQAATAEAGVVFLATNTESATVVLAAGEGCGVDAGAVLKAALQAVGGRGGGSATLAQGVVSDAAQLDTVVEAIRPAP